MTYPPDLICPDCGNTEWFADYTQQEANYLHYQCYICGTELTGWKDYSLRDDSF